VVYCPDMILLSCQQMAVTSSIVSITLFPEGQIASQISQIS